MKKYLFIALFSTPFISFAQEIYSNTVNTKYYLFLGSYQGVNMKMLDTVHHNLEWINIDNDNLSQVGFLKGNDFVNTVLSNNLYFQVRSNESFIWTAQIRKNTFFINDSESNINEKISIVINDDTPETYLSFKNEDQTLYGTIKKVSQEDNKTICSNTENSLWRTSFVYKEKSYEGCTMIQEN